MIEQNSNLKSSEGISGLFLEPAVTGNRSKWFFNRYLILIFRVVLAAVFIYAGLNKISNPMMFADQIKMYEIIGTSPFLYMVAIFLPWLEIICGLAVLTGILIRGGALIITVLMAFFTAVVAYRAITIIRAAGVPFFEINFDCGCGFEPTYAWKKLVENVGLFLFSLAVFLSPSFSFVMLRAGGTDQR
jgi:uncharacterized membrane protein YphA (DoxX/SURF4 family)